MWAARQRENPQYSILFQISNGTLRYLTETSNTNLRPVKAELPYFVSDGNWHRLYISLTDNGKVVFQLQFNAAKISNECGNI